MIITSLYRYSRHYREVNDNLAKAAQAIYKSWFIDFESFEFDKSIADLPLGFSNVHLSDVCSINADNYSSNENWTFINYLDTSNITNGKIEEIQQLDCEMDKIPSRARRKVLPWDIVYSTVRPIQNHYGIIIEPVENMLVSTGFSVIRSSVKSISTEQIYLLLTRDETIEKLQQIAENSTSTYPSIKPSDIGNCVIVMPPKDVSMEFSRIVAPLFNQIEQNNKQSLLLQNMRDTLLPKLMSGEIDVSQISN